MKTIKIWDGITVTIDGESYTAKNNDELWEILGITDEKFPNKHDSVVAMRTGVIRHLSCFGRADLTDAYRGHTVMLSVCPAKD